MKQCGCIAEHEVERKEVNAYRQGLRDERKRVTEIVKEWAANEEVIYKSKMPSKWIDEIAKQLNSSYAKLLSDISGSASTGGKE